MNQGIKRLNKRQIKKLTNPDNYRTNKRYDALYIYGSRQLSGVARMYYKGQSFEKVIKKTDEVFKFCLKICGLSFEKFLNNYKSSDCHYYNLPYLEGVTLKEALDDLASDVGYISDRYSEYRMYRFYYYLELCKYLLNQQISSSFSSVSIKLTIVETPITFISQDFIINEACGIIINQVEKFSNMKDFAEYYNNHIQELIDINTEDGRNKNYNPYDDSFYKNEYEAVNYIRYALGNYKNSDSNSEDNTNKKRTFFHLYQLMYAIRQAERVTNKIFLKTDFIFR
jgi:hypothetical protein